MKKAAVIFAQGCEEGEALTIVDILRRAELKCDMVGLDSREITGAHDVTMRTDKVLTEDAEDYDMIVLPGGYGGTDAMAASELLKTVLKNMNEKGKYIAAMCAAPIALDAAGLLEGKTFTCYPGTADKIHSGTRTDDKVVVDGNLITSQGPATAYAFAYRLADVLGADSLTVKKRMAYFNAFDVQEDE
jgi:4-methyl-5(b-hydroxyethyl)-thiazole monophosphate biosynthesis